MRLFVVINHIQGFSIVPEKDSKVLFRVGDFTLNGYPDLIVTLAPKGSKAGTSARIVENLPCSHCDANDTRYIIDGFHFF